MGLNESQENSLQQRSLLTEQYNILIKLYLSVKNQKNKGLLLFTTLIGAIIILMACFVAVSNDQFTFLGSIYGLVFSFSWLIYNHFLNASLSRKEFMILNLEDKLKINIFSEELTLIKKSQKNFKRFFSLNTDEILPYSMIIIFLITLFFYVTINAFP